MKKMLLKDVSKKAAPSKLIKDLEEKKVVDGMGGELRLPLKKAE